MQERDLTETDVCALCGEELDPQDPRTFGLGTSLLVCYECARSHGGVYDSELENWRVPPHLPHPSSKMPKKE
jgi:hypothetical protein